MFVVYEIKFIGSGKSYIGATAQGLSERMKQHERVSRRGAGSVLHRAMTKSGRGGYTVNVIATAASAQEMFDKEVQIIAELNTKHPNGYNLTDGGEGVIELSEESQQARRDKIKACYEDPDYVARRAEAMVRFWDSPEGDQARLRSSGIRKGKKQPEHVMRAAAEAKKKPEYLAALRVRVKKQWEDPKMRESFSATKRATHLANAPKFPFNVDSRILFLSSRDAARWAKSQGFNKAAPGNIVNACNGKSNTSYGYKWRWMDREEVDHAGMEPLHVPE